ncbi:MAG: 50S ribosomal protein L6 [Spartobacteria bacterium]|nr:50S ribosomal protein L6 [Spartobacteria bacterium]
MSRIGNNPVAIGAGVTVKVEDRQVKVAGPKGELAQDILPGIAVAVKGAEVVVSRENNEIQTRAFHGTMRSLIANMIEGVTKGYEKRLEIHGVGFRAQLQGNKLTMQVGYSHPIEYTVPDGVEVTCPDATNIIIAGMNKHLVGEVSARLRDYCPAEPYKGKGIRYKGEHIRRKAGKTVA